MTDIRIIMENYKEVRTRLRQSPHALPDAGIDLRGRKKPTVPLFPERIIAFAEPTIPKPKPVYKPFRRTDLTFSSTLRFTAYEFHLTDAAIRSRSRIQSISLPRQVAVYLASKNNLQSLAGMGRYLHMDHTTMIHAKQKITALMASDATLRDRILALEARILAAFSRITVPAIRQPHLGSEEAEGHATVGQISPVDKGS